MNVLLMGPPGAGKGTQAERIAEEGQLPHISTGDIFRAAINSGTELGKKVKEYLDAGKLVPDELTVAIVKNRLQQPDCQKGFLLDGFPRTLAQAEALDLMLQDMGLQLDLVINIAVIPDTLVKRLSGRRICRKCGVAYHVEFQPPEQVGVCDRCGGELYQRNDDQSETISERLDVYTKQTAPLLDYYHKSGLLSEVDGNKNIVQVWLAIKSLLRSIMK